MERSITPKNKKNIVKSDLMLFQVVPGTKSAEKRFGPIWSRGMFAGSSVIFSIKKDN